ncbi:3-deoxy-manno-octulosonate cytidylyltransferase [candidate division MSBL1 archaeon SCGC-AAA382A20]|uniref:3-deoxy-manno-octulosonate cytidylyltransferase n=1 Tax=candidate division MSBL1 archaeon SCGC-AAA382A20 TaxID=1698280 RepID=A0A133VHU1_9EURY|nr:3-deoxy-manno-octulosonate cytidylyltransferase [candidate division MSBL1 archaeon SCGC-AAA382A20]
MEIVAIIPARMGSTRYPGKPLVDIRGMTMVEHVYRRTELSEAVDEVYVATPDSEIEEEVKNFGGNAIPTGPHERCTDRVAEAAQNVNTEIVVNVQGDEPLLHPDMIDLALKPFRKEKNEEISAVNLIKEIKDEKEFENTNVIKVIKDSNWNALYMSREPIPTRERMSFTDLKTYRQVCVIPFKKNFLMEYSSLPPTPLEKAESIDMLRAIENGYKIKLIESDFDTWAVDVPEDREIVKQKLKDDEIFPRYKTQN